MIKFEVLLTETDIKNFIKHKMNLKSKKTILPFLTHLICAIILVFANFFYDFGIVGWLAAAAFFAVFGFNIYKIYNTYQKVLVKNLDIVNKNRKFFIDQHVLSILCDSNSDFCGRYPIYDLKSCIKSLNCWSLMLIILNKCYNGIGYKFNFKLNYYLRIGGNSYE